MFFRLHVEHNEWGLSYIKEGKLDMRYDNENSQVTAADIVKKRFFSNNFLS